MSDKKTKSSKAKKQEVEPVDLAEILDESDPDQYNFIAPDKIEYFPIEDEKIPPENDTCKLSVRLSVVPSSMLRILDSEENARYMTADQMRRLSDNLKLDRALTSTILVYPEENGKKLAVLSGNHRSEAAIKAGLKKVPVIVIQTALNRERRQAIQLSHNAINGQDDPNLLKKIYENLSMAGKAYSGLTDDYFKLLEKIDIDGLSLGGPKYEEVTLLFLPSEKEAFMEQIARLEKVKDGNAVLLAHYEDFFTLFNTIVEVKQFKNVFNSAVAIRQLADLAMERLEQLKAEQEENEANKDGEHT